MALYVHCLAHMLNLVLKDAVDGIEEMRIFYTWDEVLFVFLTGSIIRWILMKFGIPHDEIPEGKF